MTHPLFHTLAGLLLVSTFLVPTSSKALFYAASRAVHAADAHLENAQLAESEGRREDALHAYDEAVKAYTNIRQKDPDYQAEHIALQLGTCRKHMLGLFAAAEEESKASEQARTQALAQMPAAEVAASDLPRNQVHSSAPPIAAPKSPRTEVPRSLDEPASSALSHKPSAPPPTGSSLEQRIEYYLKHNRAAEAIVELDTLMGNNPDHAPYVQRLLLGRALVTSGNYARAIAILTPLVTEYPTDPAALTLAAGANLAHGNTYSAVQLLDTLVKAHPSYADAYINLAYTRFAMDPTANRNEAILYYKHALRSGATRDRNLEEELRIKISLP